ncbi:cation-translocating P-type ATPase [Deinococcus planocerae]|uniref:cation-translocating P-type ATPase n=1 Tax=Deinococcus planocerae TaxID=1737569 RepID=UPI000C7F32FE|nr:HAD-IC family P-type ATPase [Deinococcus planocerae]
MSPVAPRSSPRPPPWHAAASEDVFARLETAPEGLGDAEAARRLERYGRNALPAREPPSVWRILLRQLLNPLIYILIAAALLALATGDLTDAAFVLIVIGINAGLGTYQEYGAERNAAALQNLVRVRARVLRGGRERDLDGEDLVPGDVVRLESGDRVPADLRLVGVRELAVDEATLTGESEAVRKHAGALEPDLPLGDRLNLAFAGTAVQSGRATGVVVETGLRTELGRIAEHVSGGAETKPPLLVRIDRFAHQISVVVLAAAALLVAIAVAQGTPFAEVFYLAVALAVSAIPEGLPVALTVVLSVATTRMLRRQVIVRRLTAVESLGSSTVIASDKTGTLTVNRQTAQTVVLPTGARYTTRGDGDLGAEDPRLRRVARAFVLANEGRLEQVDGETQRGGDAVDVALLELGRHLGVPPELRGQVEPLGDIPYESERGYAATFYQDEQGRARVAVKGGAGRVLPFCDRALGQKGEDRADVDALTRLEEGLAGEGYRVLAMADGEMPDTDGPFDEAHLPPLCLLGFVGLIDPLRPSSVEAVRTARRAGMRVAMVTGDHPATALAIAREAGIADEGERPVTGRDLATLGDAELREAVGGTNVFARVEPLQKLRIVEALAANGQYVTVTGDGVNDAPALKRAHVGVAMGSGTDVAKEASDLIVTDDNFASIVAGVEEGRTAYANVRKVVYFLVSSGVAEVLLFLTAVALGFPIPLTAVQILWLNIVTNGFQHIGLSLEPGERGQMTRPPRRPGEGIFDRLMVSQLLLSGMVMAALVFVTFTLTLQAGASEFAARNVALLLMVLLQNFHALNARSETESTFRLPFARSRVLLLAIVGAQLVHLAATQIPLMQRVLGLEPVPFAQWLPLLLLAALVVVAMEIFKWFWRRGERGRAAPQGDPA